MQVVAEGTSLRPQGRKHLEFSKAPPGVGLPNSPFIRPSTIIPPDTPRAAEISYIDCTRSFYFLQRLCTIDIVRPEIVAFWVEVRNELRRNYGQEPGRRDWQKALRRNDLAKELGLSGRTLKGFINGNQAGLGRDALLRLFGKMPALQRRYAELGGRPDLAPGRAHVETRDRNELYIQLTLQLEGSGEPPKTLTARLPPGREGLLTLKIDSGRVA
jgi:hypothetical protein